MEQDDKNPFSSERAVSDPHLEEEEPLWERRKPVASPNNVVLGESEVQEQHGDIDTDKLIYKLDDNPPFHLTLLFALQQVSIAFSASIGGPMVSAEIMCIGDDNVGRAKIVATSLVMAGISTLLQCTVGTRLCIIQGSSFSFIPPVAAMMAAKSVVCANYLTAPDNGLNATTSPNDSFLDTESWKLNIREVQGGIMMACITSTVLGCTGVVGIFSRWVGPLTTAPVLCMIGFALIPEMAAMCGIHWGIAIIQLVLVSLFAMYIKGYQIPCLTYKDKKCTVVRYPLFLVFSGLLALVLTWIVSYIMTVTDVLPNDKTSKTYLARTDAKMSALYDTPWFYLPYPGQWGPPIFTLAGWIGFFSSAIACTIESIGDYYACAEICQIPVPPEHAINRGIAAEGFAGFLSALFGSGASTTSYANNIGFVQVTKVASRTVYQVAGIMMIVAGVFGKFGAVLSMIPDPVLGSLLLFGLGLVVAVGMGQLRHIDSESSRNMCIVGLAFMLGLVLPLWMRNNPGAIKTGSATLDQCLAVLGGTSMFVGGFVGFVLDNTVPGTPKERGLLGLRGLLETESTMEGGKAIQKDVDLRDYDLPYITKYLKGWNWSRYCPISPTYEGLPGCPSKCSKRKKTNSQLIASSTV